MNVKNEIELMTYKILHGNLVIDSGKFWANKLQCRLANPSFPVSYIIFKNIAAEFIK